MLILKFGGSSVSTKKSIQTIGKLVIENKVKNPVVVVSAIKSVTDLLLLLKSSRATRSAKLRKISNIHVKLIKQLWSDKKDQNTHIDYIAKLINEISLLLKSSVYTPELQDRIVSYGEIMSSYIIAQALVLHGITTKQIIASSIVVTNDNFGAAEFYPDLTKRKVILKLQPLIECAVVPIITGFIGATRSGRTTTLGRGGSDYSAAIIGYCLEASEIQIWTDVSGIYSADPKIVKNAKVLKSISCELAGALADSGAKVLHPKTIKTAVRNKIPIRILNTFSPNSDGTSIVDNNQCVTENIICAVTYKHVNQNQISVSLIGLNLNSKLLLKEVTSFFSNYNIQNVHLSNYNNLGYHFLIDSDNPKEIIRALHNKFIA